MQIKEIIMYVLMTAACIIPIVFLVRAASAKSRQVVRSLKQICGQLPPQYDIWQTRGLAFDERAQKLVYVNHDSEVPLTVTVQAGAIADIQVHINGRKASGEKKTLEPAGVSTIDLLVAEQSGESHTLRFFEMEQDGPFQANFHYQLAKKWKKLVAENTSRQLSKA